MRRVTGYWHNIALLAQLDHHTNYYGDGVDDDYDDDDNDNL